MHSIQVFGRRTKKDYVNDIKYIEPLFINKLLWLNGRAYH